MCAGGEACKFADGSADSTCRRNNKEWPAGNKAMERIPSAWPASDEPLRSCRQFAILVPLSKGAREITLPTLWNRLMDKA